MKLPQGFEFEKPNQVCKLRRSLYGLKQASRQWNSKLSAALLQMMFVQSKSDPSLFTKGEGATFIVVLIYVDDILLTSPDISQIQNLKMYLDNAFKIKDLGELGYFLGIEARSSDTGLNLCQCKYAMDILTETGFLECKPASSPMVPGIHLCHGDSEPFANIGSYRRLRIMSCDISNEPLGRASFYPKGEATQLNVFSDSDWAICSESRRSITGFCVFLGSALISWKCKKQSTVSRSSSEAEYRALAATVSEVQWITFLLSDLQMKMKKPAAVFCDNKSAIAIAENSVFHERTKHIEIDCHLVREKVSQGLIKLLSVSSSNQTADGFTKPLPIPQFQLFTSKLGTQDLYAPTYGGCWKKKNKEACSSGLFKAKIG
ncbi:PREDICTED: uncharacterized protein LOC109181210 [Ipomoea nil]|uniref:uncharacterized protein LOC109181210 n=1 Tax=Ipomoea nil TaxID=35883 RepID=UPI000900987A|nr:PREDICTED: uncharacterized protein LOC109181210 [Ipomoea nil]